MKSRERVTKNKGTVIVFGGSGFLGSHVADALTDEGYRVRIFDQRPSPYLRVGQEMIVGDTMDADKVRDAVKGCRFVYNFSGIADLDDASTKPVDTARENILANLHIMDAAVAAKAERFLYASTIYVYSRKGGFYRCSKQASEVFIEAYQDRYGLDFTVLRYGTLYGPRADMRNSIHRYLVQALQKGVIQCIGSGEEVRDYVHVRDAARLSVQVLDKAYRNKHIIISGNHPVKYRDMLYTIREILGKNIKIQFTKKVNTVHYDYTPYSFAPKIGHKLTNHLYLDMGQGLLECLEGIHATTRARSGKTAKV